MNNIIKIFLGIFIVIILFYFLESLYKINEKTIYPESIVIAGDEWLPYNGLESGILLDVLIDILEKENIEVIYVNDNWEQCLEKTSKGVYDIVLGTTEVEIVGYNIINSQTIFSTTQGVLVAKKIRNIKINSIDDILLYNFGYVPFYSYGIIIDNFIISNIHYKNLITFEQLNTTTYMIQATRDNVIDFFIEDKNVFLYYYNKTNFDDLKIIYNFDNEQNMYVGFHNDIQGQRLKQLIDNRMRFYIKTGEYQKIINKYIKSDQNAEE